jgi:regulator of replication initiation timing
LLRQITFSKVLKSDNAYLWNLVREKIPSKHRTEETQSNFLPSLRKKLDALKSSLTSLFKETAFLSLEQVMEKIRLSLLSNLARDEDTKKSVLAARICHFESVLFPPDVISDYHKGKLKCTVPSKKHERAAFIAVHYNFAELTECWDHSISTRLKEVPSNEIPIENESDGDSEDEDEDEDEDTE